MILALAVILAGCGSSGGSSSSEATEAASTEEASSTETEAAGEEEAAEAEGGSETAGLPPYPSPGESFPTEYKPVKKQSGVEFKLAFLNPYRQAPALRDVEDHAKAKAEELGGSFIGFNAEESADKQVTQFAQALNEGATAIVCWPVNTSSLKPELAQAEKEGIPVIGIQAEPAASKGKLPGYVSDLTQNLDAAAYYSAAAVAKESPGATFVTMGDQGSEPVFQYLSERLKYWGEKEGLKFEGEVPTATPSPEDTVKAGETILTRYPSVEAILTIDDLNAVGALQAAGQKGVTPLITGTNGEKIFVEDIAAGRGLATYWYKYSTMGESAAVGAYSAQTEQNLPLPEVVVNEGVPVTKVNASEILPQLSY
jgi:ABC-type sugar transport system substrate-binding protein